MPRLRLSPLLPLVPALLAGLSATAQAAQWQIKPGDSIQAAIARAAPGDTLRIARGTYLENLRIDKPLTLVGDGRPPSTAAARATPSASPPPTCSGRSRRPSTPS